MKKWGGETTTMKHLIDQERREGVDLESTISHQFEGIITRFKKAFFFFIVFSAREYRVRFLCDISTFA